MVRMERGNHAPGRIVEEHRAHPDARTELMAMRGAEERLELANRLALVVEDRPARADPTRTDDWRVRIVDVEWTRFRLHFPLNLAAEAIGVREGKPNLQAL